MPIETSTSKRHWAFLTALVLAALVAITAVMARGLQQMSAELATAGEHAIPAAMAATAPLPAPSTAQTSTSAPTPAAPAGADRSAGEAAAAPCKGCHSFEAGAPAGLGPNLHGIVGHAVAARPGFDYSPALRKHAEAIETWSTGELDRFLADVQGTVPGTKMAWPGVPSASDRANLIAFLAGTAGAEQAADAASPAPAAAATPPADAATDPAPPSAARRARAAEAVRALEAELPTLDYQRARYHRLHFKPAIESASDGECLVCHGEILQAGVREKSPAGVAAAEALAWYQTLATYDGAQLDFHQRHIASPYAKAVMNLKCNFCHQGNDPREESPTMVGAAAKDGVAPFTNRKMVNPSETCLRCHGAMPDPKNVMGLGAAWPEARKTLESAALPNGCGSCHAVFRTVRHRVDYLNAKTIEDLASASSDVCYGCHGGRAWYRISYPYPRHAWPGMPPAVPAWAKDRPTESDARFRVHADP